MTRDELIGAVVFRDWLAARQRGTGILGMPKRRGVAAVLDDVWTELEGAFRRFGRFHSPHEGYAVIAEELDELWDEVKANRGRHGSARHEAIQVAAMAVRYLVDLNLDETPASRPVSRPPLEAPEAPRPDGDDQERAAWQGSHR